MLGDSLSQISISSGAVIFKALTVLNGCLLLQDIKFNVHAHPTLSEVLDELFKQAHVAKLDRAEVRPDKKEMELAMATS